MYVASFSICVNGGPFVHYIFPIVVFLMHDCNLVRYLFLSCGVWTVRLLQNRLVGRDVLPAMIEHMTARHGREKKARFPTAIESWKASVFVRNMVHMPAGTKA